MHIPSVRTPEPMERRGENNIKPTLGRLESSGYHKEKTMVSRPFPKWGKKDECSIGETAEHFNLEGKRKARKTSMQDLVGQEFFKTGTA